MISLHGLLYPVTYVQTAHAHRLGQVFRRVSVLVPTEDAPPCRQPWENGMEIVATIPAPLGDRLPWFANLIAGWETWARQMGLDRDIPAGPLLPALSTLEDESVTHIIASLKEPASSDPVIEAQIMLQLAHHLDMNEDQLERDLEEVARQEGSLKAIMQGPVCGEIASKAHSSPAFAALARPGDRLRSWARLWLAQPARCGAWPVGFNISTRDLVENAYTKLAPGEVPFEILRLALPEDPQMRPGCDPQIAGGLAALVESMARPGQGPSVPQDLGALAAEVDDLWNRKIKGGRTGPTLGLTVFPGIEWADIMASVAMPQPISTRRGAGGIGWSFFLY